MFGILWLFPGVASYGLEGAIVDGVIPEHPLAGEIGKFINRMHITDDIAIFNMCNQVERARDIIRDLVDGYVIIDGRLRGVVGNILDETMGYLNATYRLITIKPTNRENPFAAVGTILVMQRADFNFNFQFLHPEYMKQKFLTWTTPVALHRMCCLVPYKPDNPDFIDLINHCGKGSYLLYIAFMFITAILWFYTQRPRISFGDSLWLLLRVVFLSVIPRRFPFFSERLIVGAAFVASFFIISTLQSLLIAEIVKPHHPAQINSLDELKRMKLPILVLPGMASFLKGMENELPLEITLKIQESPLNPWIVRRQNIRNEIIFALDVFKVQNFVDSVANMDANGHPIYHIMNECLIHSPAIFPFPRNSPYLSHINNLLRWYFEAGMYNHWLLMERHKLLVEHSIVDPEELQAMHNEVMVTYGHLKTTLPIILAGWVLSSVVLLLEILYARCSFGRY
ncbi:uncharacterized protein LOC129794508 [Lutzomyia longipalpis]|uniref:uncharacterized protein LOC129794508 n=1 Tax=Lutzomyia longipalpis TaxID=7200 RepID=UPI0024837E2B|nr:uncharacterized protein LOC129794508 [Lutzomyia longipalpis]